MKEIRYAAISVKQALVTICRLFLDLVRYVYVGLRSDKILAAENLFLRKQLALYQERQVRPRRIDAATRIALVFLSKRFNWRPSLLIVQPATLVHWHRQGFRLFWRWKSRPGRPRIPIELRRLIREMALDNVSWGEERIANELLLKLGIRVSPRTVSKYMPKPPGRGHRGDQRWRTFVRNHASAIVACDFCITFTATFRLFYVLVVIEHGSRRLLHCNVTEYPTAEWTLQQLREAIPCEHPYRFLIHDNDNIFSKELDTSISRLGIDVIETPYRSPQANSICERVIGSMRRECLDYMIPLNETHLRKIVKDWVVHYNRSRPHSALGPSVPDPPPGIPVSIGDDRHRIADKLKVISTPVLGGLHHEYALAPV